MPLSPADYAAPSLQNAPEAAAEPAEAAAPAAPAAKPDLKKLVAFAGDHFGVDPNVLAGMLMKESSLQDDVISGQRKSSAGAVGIAQFMPDTAKEVRRRPDRHRAVGDGHGGLPARQPAEVRRRLREVDRRLQLG